MTARGRPVTKHVQVGLCAIPASPFFQQLPWLQYAICPQDCHESDACPKQQQRTAAVCNANTHASHFMQLTSIEHHDTPDGSRLTSTDLDGTAHSLDARYPKACMYISCRDAAKQEALQLLFERLHSSAQASSTESSAESSAESTNGPVSGSEPSNDKANGTARHDSAETDEAGPAVWTKLYLAQHYDHMGDTGTACCQ